MVRKHVAPAGRVAEFLEALHLQGEFVVDVSVDGGRVSLLTHHISEDGAPPALTDKAVLSMSEAKPQRRRSTPNSKEV